jgi:DNA polymerase-3 subunit delta'
MARLTRLPWQSDAWRELQALRARHAHAILLHGAAGIGKKLLALDLAEAVLCARPRPDGHRCGQCAECVMLDAGTHPDLRVLVPDTHAALRPVGGVDDDLAEADAASVADATEPPEREGRVKREIPIDAVRQLADFMHVSTQRGGARALMLAPAEALGAAAANALLKMLEEPAAGTLFVLATDALDDVLPTIRSRCVLLRVASPAHGQVLAWLREQGVAQPEDDLAAAGGAPLHVLDDATGIRLSADDRGLLLGLLAQGRSLAAAEVAARVTKTLPVAPSIALFQRWAWDLLAHQFGQPVRYHPAHLRVVGSVASSVPATAWLRWMDELNRQRASAEHPLNSKLVIESALFGYIDACRMTATIASASPPEGHA